MEPKNHADLVKIQGQKMATYYKVKDIPGTVTKDVDTSKRIVKSIPNTLMYFDSDSDVLLTGCGDKSIAERGPDSTTAAKIKNVKDHDIAIRIGKPLVIDERKMDGMDVFYAESKMLSTTVGDDQLIEYQEGVIDQHSIGYRYINIDLVTADDKAWKAWLNKIINPEKAEKSGYMFLVKEIDWFEWSPVSFGANDLTPYLGVKSENKEGVILKLHGRLDVLEKQLRAGKQTDVAMFDYELEVRQLKQIITELFTKEPSIKDTLLQRRQQEDTHGKGLSATICPSCLKDFNYDPAQERVNCPGCGQFVDLKTNFTVDFDWSKHIKETNFLNF